MLRCSPEAFAKCPTRHICGNIEDATFMEGSECDLFNQSVANKPTINADRICATIEGRWKGAGMGDYRCSICDETVSGNSYKYCPYCGAKMDGGTNGKT